MDETFMFINANTSSGLTIVEDVKQVYIVRSKYQSGVVYKVKNN